MHLKYISTKLSFYLLVPINYKKNCKRNFFLRSSNKYSLEIDFHTQTLNFCHLNFPFSVTTPTI